MNIKKSTAPPSFFSSERFLATRDGYLKQLADGLDPNYGSLSKFKRDINQALLEEFHHRCGYCHSVIDSSDHGCVDRFYPKRLFPERVFDWDNLILSCQMCNVAKRDKFPTDANGNPLLLNPRTDDYDQHLTLHDDGTLEGLTPKGMSSIEVLHLNRATLVEARRREHLYEKLTEERPELRAALLDDDFYSRFLASITNSKTLNEVTGLAPSTEQSMRYMLFANVITCLETYLADALITTVKGSRRLMRNFVETFQDFKNSKFGLNEVFTKYYTIDEVAIRAMADVIFHDLAKVKGIYRATLGISFPTNIGDLYRAVTVRHDIVHRNGKKKSGDLHAISSDDVKRLAEQVSTFVSDIQGKIIEVSHHHCDEIREEREAQ